MRRIVFVLSIINAIALAFGSVSHADTGTGAEEGRVRKAISKFEEQAKSKEPREYRLKMRVKDFDELKRMVRADSLYEITLGHDYTDFYNKHPTVKMSGSPLVVFNHPWQATGKEIADGLFDELQRAGDIIVKVSRIVKR